MRPGSRPVTRLMVGLTVAEKYVIVQSRNLGNRISGVCLMNTEEHNPTPSDQLVFRRSGFAKRADSVADEMYHMLYKSLFLQNPPVKRLLQSKEFIQFNVDNIGMMVGAHYFHDHRLGRMTMLSYHSSFWDTRIAIPILLPTKADTFVKLSGVECDEILRELGEGDLKWDLDFSSWISRQWDALSDRERRVGAIWCEDGEVSAFLLDRLLQTIKEQTYVGGSTAKWLADALENKDGVLYQDLIRMGLIDENGAGMPRLKRMMEWLRALSPDDARWNGGDQDGVPWIPKLAGESLKGDPSSADMACLEHIAKAMVADRSWDREGVEFAARFHLAGHSSYLRGCHQLPVHIVEFPVIPLKRERKTKSIDERNTGLFVGAICAEEGESLEDVEKRLRLLFTVMCLIGGDAARVLHHETAALAERHAVLAWLQHLRGNSLIAAGRSVSEVETRLRRLDNAPLDLCGELAHARVQIEGFSRVMSVMLKVKAGESHGIAELEEKKIEARFFVLAVVRRIMSLLAEDRNISSRLREDMEVQGVLKRHQSLTEYVRSHITTHVEPEGLSFHADEGFLREAAVEMVLNALKRHQWKHGPIEITLRGSVKQIRFGVTNSVTSRMRADLEEAARHKLGLGYNLILSIASILGGRISYVFPDEDTYTMELVLPR